MMVVNIFMGQLLFHIELNTDHLRKLCVVSGLGSMHSIPFKDHDATRVPHGAHIDHQSRQSRDGFSPKLSNSSFSSLSAAKLSRRVSSEFSSKCPTMERTKYPANERHVDSLGRSGWPLGLGHSRGS